MSTFLNASPIFGPVRSRRLGLSLGVNMMPASGKICTFDCIYCENGLNAERPEVHDTLMMVDDNILKLDTVDPAFIQLLDQPVSPYDVEHQIETFASFDGHVIIQTIFLTGEYQGKLIDNTGEEYVAPWLAALERIRPQEATIYTVARETPIAGLAKAAPDVLDAIAARVQALGIPCQVSY